MIDRIALTIAILGCLYLGIAGIFNIEIAPLNLHNPFSLLKRFMLAMTGSCGMWCFSFFFKHKKKHNIEI